MDGGMVGGRPRSYKESGFFQPNRDRFFPSFYRLVVVALFLPFVVVIVLVDLA